MILRIYKGTGPEIIFLIILTFIALWISAFLRIDVDPIPTALVDPMPLFKLLIMLVGSTHLVQVLISFLFVALITFLVVNFNTTQFFINERTYYPAIIYLVLGALFPQYQSLNPVLPATVFLMLSIKRIMDGYREPGIAYNFFDSGILISIGTLFYADLIWFGLLLIIGIALLRTGNLKEVTLSVIGLITPYLIILGFYYVMGYSLPGLLHLAKDNLFVKTADYEFSREIIVTLVIIGLVVLASIWHLFMIINTKKIKSRKTFWLLFWVFLISLGVYFAVPSASVEIIFIAGIPVSYFLSHYFIFSRKKLIPEIFFSLIFFLIILIQVLYFI